MTRTLSTVLQQAYGDRYTPWVGDAGQVRIDDEDARDTCISFCRMSVWVHDDRDTSNLELENSPYNEGVVSFIADLGGRIDRTPRGANITLTVRHAGGSRSVRELAKAIRRVTGRGQRYPDPNWKWIARRTADSLERFASFLTQANRAARQTARTPVIDRA